MKYQIIGHMVNLPFKSACYKVTQKWKSSTWSDLHILQQLSDQYRKYGY